MKSNNSTQNAILLLVPGFPVNEADSTCIPALQQYVYHFAKSNPQRRITVIAFQYPYTKQEYNWHGVDVHPCGGRARNRLGRLMTWMTAGKHILQVHLKNRITLIHSFWLEECAFVGQLMSKVLSAKHVATIMGQDALHRNQYLKRLNYSSMIITAGSSNAADAFYRSTGYQVDAIIPIGLDVDNFDSNMNKESRRIDILGVGSLIALKNYGMFIEIIRELVQDFADLEAVIVGDGEERRNLEGMIAENRLGNHVRLVGELPRAEAIQYMYRSKILLHTSSYESQGYVFGEALYCGLTVVCFDVGCAEESERMIVCAEKKEMVKNLKRILTRDLTNQPVLLKSIDETVHEFEQVYDS